MQKSASALLNHIQSLGHCIPPISLDSSVEEHMETISFYLKQECEEEALASIHCNWNGSLANPKPSYYSSNKTASASGPQDLENWLKETTSFLQFISTRYATLTLCEHSQSDTSDTCL